MHYFEWKKLAPKDYSCMTFLKDKASDGEQISSCFGRVQREDMTLKGEQERDLEIMELFCILLVVDVT